MMLTHYFKKRLASWACNTQSCRATYLIIPVILLDYRPRFQRRYSQNFLDVPHQGPYSQHFILFVTY
jgi:hypothetical protein